MGPKTSKRPEQDGPKGPAYQHLTEADFQQFYDNLVKTSQITSVMEGPLNRLESYLNNIPGSGVVAAALDPLRRDVLMSKAALRTAIDTADSQSETAAKFLEDDHFGAAIQALNSGVIAIQELRQPFDKLQRHLNGATSKYRGAVLESLEAHNFAAEVEAWDNSMTDWYARTTIASWSPSQDTM